MRMGACVCVRERAAVVVHQVCENVAVGGFFFVVHTVSASCQAIAHPPGIISAGCGREENSFCLHTDVSESICSYYGQKIISKVWLPYFSAYLHACVCFSASLRATSVLYHCQNAK